MAYIYQSRARVEGGEGSDARLIIIMEEGKEELFFFGWSVLEKEKSGSRVAAWHFGVPVQIFAGFYAGPTV